MHNGVRNGKSGPIAAIFLFALALFTAIGLLLAFGVSSTVQPPATPTAQPSRPRPARSVAADGRMMSHGS